MIQFHNLFYIYSRKNANFTWSKITVSSSNNARRYNALTQLSKLVRYYVFYTLVISNHELGLIRHMWLIKKKCLYYSTLTEVETLISHFVKNNNCYLITLNLVMSVRFIIFDREDTAQNCPLWNFRFQLIIFTATLSWCLWFWRLLYPK